MVKKEEKIVTRFYSATSVIVSRLKKNQVMLSACGFHHVPGVISLLCTMCMNQV